MSRRSSRRSPTDAERDARRHADRERIERAAHALLTTRGVAALDPRACHQRPLALQPPEAKISGRCVAKSLQTYRIPRSPARSASWQQGPRQRAIFTSPRVASPP
jgi:hypothetical protein